MVVIWSSRRGRVFLLAAVVTGALGAVTAVSAERDARLLLLPAVTVLWLGQWLVARRNGVVLGQGWVDVRNNALRPSRVRWDDVISAEPEPWLRGQRLRLWTLEGLVTTPSVSEADLAVLLAAFESSRNP